MSEQPFERIAEGLREALAVARGEAGFSIKTDAESNLYVTLDGKQVCDFYDDGYTRTIVIEIIECIAEIKGISVAKDGPVPDPDEIWDLSSDD